jgi:hypothetical protein
VKDTNSLLLPRRNENPDFGSGEPAPHGDAWNPRPRTARRGTVARDVHYLSHGDTYEFEVPGAGTGV